MGGVVFYYNNEKLISGYDIANLVDEAPKAASYPKLNNQTSENGLSNWFKDGDTRRSNNRGSC
jgi:hypothetical protein